MCRSQILKGDIFLDFTYMKTQKFFAPFRIKILVETESLLLPIYYAIIDSTLRYFLSFRFKRQMNAICTGDLDNKRVSSAGDINFQSADVSNETMKMLIAMGTSFWILYR